MSSRRSKIIVPRGRKEKKKQEATRQSAREAQKTTDDASKLKPKPEHSKPQSGRQGQPQPQANKVASQANAETDASTKQTIAPHGPLRLPPNPLTQPEKSTFRTYNDPSSPKSLSKSTAPSANSFTQQSVYPFAEKQQLKPDKSARNRLFSPVPHVPGKFDSTQKSFINTLVNNARAQPEVPDPRIGMAAGLEDAISQRDKLKGLHSETFAFNKYANMEDVGPLMNAKKEAKLARMVSNTAYEEAYKTFSKHQAGSYQSNQAFLNAIRKTGPVAETGPSYAEALMHASSSITGADPAKATYHQACHRQACRSEVEAAKNDAFRNGYLSSATNNIARSYDKDHPARKQAFDDAVAMRKIYGKSAKRYEQTYEISQNFRKAMSGSDTDPSEDEFPI